MRLDTVWHGRNIHDERDIRPSELSSSEAFRRELVMSSETYLLTDQPSELKRLQLQSCVWESRDRRLLDEIGEGRGARVLDVRCGAIGWLRPLNEWVGPDADELEQLRRDGEAELKEPGRWGTTFTLLKC
jgi:hypothetical protein